MRGFLDQIFVNAKQQILSLFARAPDWVGQVVSSLLNITALLVVNNLRDIPTDRESGKLTLAVRLGDRGTRILYVGLVAVALAVAVAIGTQHVFALLALLALGVIAKPLQALRSGATGRALVPVLASTGIFEIVYAVLLAAGIAVSVAV